MCVICDSICHELNYLPCASVPHRTLLIENYCPPEQTFHRKLTPDLVLFTDKTFSTAIILPGVEVSMGIALITHRLFSR